MKYLLVIITLFAPVFGAFAEKTSNFNIASQIQSNSGGLAVSSGSIEAGTSSENETKSNSLFSLFYIIPSVLIILTVILAIALSKRILFEQ